MELDLLILFQELLGEVMIYQGEMQLFILAVLYLFH